MSKTCKPLEVATTARGFEIIVLSDTIDQIVTVQQSSFIVDSLVPGNSVLYMGVSPNRAQLDKATVQSLIPHLQSWCDTGSLRCK